MTQLGYVPSQFTNGTTTVTRYRKPTQVREGLVARIAPIRGVTPKRALEQRIYLPAWLNTMTVTETALHNEYDTLSAGHFSMAAMGGVKAKQFRQASADTITVDTDPRWLTVPQQDPESLRTRLYAIMRWRKAVSLLVTFNPPLGREPELEMYCTFREIDKDVRPGENDTRYLTITIAEWRDPSGQTRSSTSSDGSRKKGVSLPATHPLTASDTLSSLSMEYYGTYDLWRTIRDANGISTRFGSNTALVTMPGRWQPGYNVKIPAAQAQINAGYLVGNS